MTKMITAHLIGALGLPAHLAREVLLDHVARIGKLDPFHVASLAFLPACLIAGAALAAGEKLAGVVHLPHGGHCGQIVHSRLVRAIIDTRTVSD